MPPQQIHSVLRASHALCAQRLQCSAALSHRALLLVSVYLSAAYSWFVLSLGFEAATASVKKITQFSSFQSTYKIKVVQHCHCQILERLHHQKRSPLPPAVTLHCLPSKPGHWAYRFTHLDQTTHRFTYFSHSSCCGMFYFPITFHGWRLSCLVDISHYILVYSLFIGYWGSLYFLAAIDLATVNIFPVLCMVMFLIFLGSTGICPGLIRSAPN